MTTSNPQRSVLVLGASQRVLDEAVAILRDLGYTAQGTSDFFTDITGRFDIANTGLVALGHLVPSGRKAELKEQIGAINPQVIFLDPPLAGIPGLIASQVQEAFTADRQDPALAPAYTPGDRSIRLILANPAAVKATVYWRTALIPPDPKSDSLVLLDEQLPAGDHKVPVPSHIPRRPRRQAGRVRPRGSPPCRRARQSITSASPPDNNSSRECATEAVNVRLVPHSGTRQDPSWADISP